MPTLLLVYEAEAMCRQRLLARGYGERATHDISSYLAQSTDLALEFGHIDEACAERGLAFRPVELDTLAAALAAHDRDRTIVWTLTDGIEFFHGSAAPALAGLHGFRLFGSDAALFALCQDKFRAGAALRALGLPCPQAGLARDGEWIVPAPPSETGWFVKPNRLGAKIGIWSDSHCLELTKAIELSRRVHAAYGDDVVVQRYVAGRNARASFLALAPDAGMDALGASFVDSGGDFQTMEQSLALYGDTGAAARQAGAYVEPRLLPVASSHPDADRRLREIAATMVRGLGLRDVFSIDARIEVDGGVHLIEFEVCPGLPCFDFRAYCCDQYGLSLPQAMAAAAARRLL